MDSQSYTAVIRKMGKRQFSALAGLELGLDAKPFLWRGGVDPDRVRGLSVGDTVHVELKGSTLVSIEPIHDRVA